MLPSLSLELSEKDAVRPLVATLKFAWDDKFGPDGKTAAEGSEQSP